MLFKAIFRLLAVTYMIMFVMYFYYRAVYSIGDSFILWRIFVLFIEFFSSISVVLVIFIRLSKPWSHRLGQKDGSAMKHLLEITEKKNNTAGMEDGVLIDVRQTITAQPGGLHMTRASDLPDNEDPNSPLLEENDNQSVTSSMNSFLVEDDSIEEIGQMKETTAGDALDETNALDELAQLQSKRCKMDRYVIRVLIPCYKEDLSVIRPTVLSALNMKHEPKNIHVYLCDDGADFKKESWVASLQNQGFFNMHYVTRPEQYKGHGKSGNLNYTLKHVIYADMKKISRRELVVIFDADMVCTRHFVRKILPYFMRDQTTALVQTPQTFHNTPMEADFFDAHNVSFFQYMLPAMSEWNVTTCCGTNFMVSARFLKKADWFPTLSVTEDMYLAMLILEKGGRIHYHAENLVVGEAPQDLRQIFQQRSRWAKGTMQIFFKDNPLFKRGLNTMQRLSFFNAAWSYWTSAFFNPTFVFINAAAILFGLFPVRDLNFVVAVLFILYYGLFFIIIHFTPNPVKHFQSLWIVGKMGHFFSFMAMKAIIRTGIATYFTKKEMNFKVTRKTVGNAAEAMELQDIPEKSIQSEEDLQEVELEHSGSEFSVAEVQKPGDTAISNEPRDSSHRDIIFHWIMSLFILFTIGTGIYTIMGYKEFLPQVVDNERNWIQRRGIRFFSTFWLSQFLVAYSIPLWYAYLPHKYNVQAGWLQFLSFFDSAISLLLVAMTIILFSNGFLSGLPSIGSITDNPPNVTPYWIDSLGAQEFVGEYIFDSALDEHIPVIVFYQRPDRDVKGYRQGGLEKWSEYRAALSTLGGLLQSKDYPSVVILEPGWLSEVFYDTTESDDPNILELVNGTDPQEYRAFDNNKYSRLVNAFTEFMGRVPSKTNVYVDVDSAYFHSIHGDRAMFFLNQSLFGRQFQGVAINTGDYFSKENNFAIGQKLSSTFGWRFVEDSSRNGGSFSERSLEQIEACSFDPPGMLSGLNPQWLEGTDEYDAGMDARLWLRVPGESDGRMFQVGEYRRCLLDHKMECTLDSCPEVTAQSDGQFLRPSRCKCEIN